MDGTPELLSISAFARRVGLAPSALRFYDDCRVLLPAHVDRSTGYRYYRPDQVPGAQLLRDLRATGLPLAEVTVVLDGDGSQAARDVLERHRTAVRERTLAADATIAAVLRSLSEDASTVVRLDGAELAAAVRQVVPAVGHDAEHPVLGCVLVEIDDGEVSLVATDRYRLSVRTLRPASVEGPPRALLVEAADLIEAGAWAARSAEVVVTADATGAKLVGAAGERELALGEGEFPAYRQILPAPADRRVIVDRTALLAVVASFDAPAVAIRFGADEIVVSLPDGSQRRELPAVCHAGPRIGFDPAVLAPALESGVGPDVLLEIAEVTGPVLVRSADQGSFTTLVMPVSLALAAA